MAGALEIIAKVDKLYPTFPNHLVTPFEDPLMATKALSIFEELMLIRSPEDWRKADIPILARLAMVIVEIDKNEILVRKSGSLVRGGKRGTTLVPNPLLGYLDKLYSRLRQLSGHVGLDSLPKDSRQLGNNAQAHLVAVEAITKASSYSDLI